MTPLRFANPSPSSGWIEDFHLQAVDHARHTSQRPPNAGGPAGAAYLRFMGLPSGSAIFSAIGPRRVVVGRMSGSGQTQAALGARTTDMATILIIGASGGLGLETVKQALAAGHTVRALARTARPIPFDHPKLRKIEGNALDPIVVQRALAGVDVVIQSIGVSIGPELIFRPVRLFSEATASLSPRRRRLERNG